MKIKNLVSRGFSLFNSGILGRIVGVTLRGEILEKGFFVTAMLTISRLWFAELEVKRIVAIFMCFDFRLNVAVFYYYHFLAHKLE